ncbi:hypothetical protein D3C86_1550930 [compost metagenome]
MNVGIGKHQDIACAVADSGVEHTVLALARQVEHLDARVVEAARQGHGLIGGAVAGDDDLQAGGVIVLGQQIAQFVLDIALLVVRGNHHTDPLRRQGRWPVSRKKRPCDCQQQRVTQVGVHRQQQAQPENEFSHEQVSWRSNDKG